MLWRSIARALPRSTSRIASFSTRTHAAFRPTLQSSIRQNAGIAQRIQPLRATFSTTAARFDDVSQELSAKLESEIQLESENSDAQHDSDSNVQRFLAENPDWTLEAPEGQQDVVLKREYDDETITLTFSIVDFNTASVFPDEEADEAIMDEEEDYETGQSGGANTKGAVNQGRTNAGNIKVAPEDSVAPADREELRNEEDEDYESQQAFPANAIALIQRGGDKGSLRINLVADSGRWTIHGVTHLPPSPDSAIDQLRNTPENLYTGPPFQQLDEEVQNLLETYLDVRGINTALAMFIPDFIDVKEQREYLSWLERVKKFVE